MEEPQNQELLDKLLKINIEQERNEVCACGSGRKYKKCCMTKLSQQKPPQAPQVPLDLWRQLYQIATEYQKLLPWEILSEDDLFAVRDPLSGAINYCCILGEAEDFLGLTLYRGREGLEMHLRLKSGDIEPDDPEILDLYNAIVIEFCDRDTLEKEDLQVIKALGSAFSGRKIYPQFRSFLPGCLPWHLTAEEVEVITLALQCAIVHVERCIKDVVFKNSLTEEERCLLYTPEDQEISWHEIEPLPPKNFAHAPLNEQRIKALEEKNLSIDTPWEVTADLIEESIISDRGRPYFARLAFIVDEDSGFLIQVQSLSPNSCPHIALRESVLSAMEKLERIPSEILVRDKASYDVLTPLADALDIDIELRDFLPGVADAQDFLKDQLSEE